MPQMPDFVRPGLMNARNIVAFVASAAVAVCAFLLVRLLIGLNDEPPAPAPAPVVITVPETLAPVPEPEPVPVPEPEPEPVLPDVLVAKQNIGSRVLLNEDMIEWREWSGELSELDTELALFKGEVLKATVINSLTEVAIEEGDLISWNKIIVPGGQGYLPSILAPGHRAITVQVDNVTTAANLIRPGDHVDVILKYTGGHVPALAYFGPSAQVIAKDVLVLAVGSHTLPKTPEGQPPQGESYTLEIHAKDVERISLASGQITLALRPYETAPLVSQAPRLIGFSDVFTMLPEPDRPPEAPPSVRVIRGSSSVERVLEKLLTEGAAEEGASAS